MDKAQLETEINAAWDDRDNISTQAGGAVREAVMATLNMRLSAPEVLIDINHIDGLSGIDVADGKVRIGALTRHNEVAASPVPGRRRLPRASWAASASPAAAS